MSINSLEQLYKNVGNCTRDLFVENVGFDTNLKWGGDKEFNRARGDVVLMGNEIDIPRNVHFIHAITAEVKFPEINLLKEFQGKYRISWTKNIGLNVFRKAFIKYGDDEIVSMCPDSNLMVSSFRWNSDDHKIWKNLIGNRDITAKNRYMIPAMTCMVPLFIFGKNGDLEKAFQSYKFQKKDTLKLIFDLEGDISKFIVVERSVNDERSGREVWEILKLNEDKKKGPSRKASDFISTKDVKLISIRKIIDATTVSQEDLKIFHFNTRSVIIDKFHLMKSKVGRNPSIDLPIDYKGGISHLIFGAKNITAQDDYNCYQNFTTYEDEALGYNPIKNYSLIINSVPRIDKATHEWSKLRTFLHGKNANPDNGLFIISHGNDLCGKTTSVVDYGMNNGVITVALGEDDDPYKDDTKEAQTENAYQLQAVALVPTIWEEQEDGSMKQKAYNEK